MNREELLGPVVSPETGEVYESGTGYKGVGIGAGIVIALGLKVFVFAGGGTDLEAEIEAGVRQARAELPVKVDEVTTITAITASGNRVNYALQIAADIPTAAIPAAQREQQAALRQSVCSTRESRRIVEAGAVLVYNYTDQTGDRFANEVGSCARG